MRLAIAGLAAALGGCGFQPAKLFSSYAEIEVREVGRSLYCNTPGGDARAVLLQGPQAVLDWQAGRGIALADSASLPPVPYAVVEMGARPTGGYGLAVSRAAVLRGELLILKATFVSPSPGSIRTQALSSPCALVQLPRGRYATVEVQDQTGAVRASGGAPAAKPPAVPAEATEPAAPGEPAEAGSPEEPIEGESPDSPPGEPEEDPHPVAEPEAPAA